MLCIWGSQAPNCEWKVNLCTSWLTALHSCDDSLCFGPCGEPQYQYNVYYDVYENCCFCDFKRALCALQNKYQYMILSSLDCMCSWCTVTIHLIMWNVHEQWTRTGQHSVIVHEKWRYHTFSERSARALPTFLIHYLNIPSQFIARCISGEGMCWYIPCQFHTSSSHLYLSWSPLRCALNLWFGSVCPVNLSSDPMGYNVHICDPETGSVYWSGRWACRELVSSGWSLM